MRNFYKIILFCALIAGSLTLRAQASYDAEQPERKDLSKDFDTGYYLIALKDDQSKFIGTYKFLKR